MHEAKPAGHDVSGGYEMPEDAGPAWRAAVQMGIDMSLIECNLELTPWERLLQNDRTLALYAKFRDAIRLIMESLAEIIRLLHRGGVEFVIVGGLAAVRHGASYLTYDVDICVPTTAVSFRKIGSAIRDINPRFRQKRDMPFELTNELLEGLRNLYLMTNLGPLDCLGDIKAVGNYQAVLEQSEWARFPFGDCRILKLDTLIQAKGAIGRPQDMLVVTQLRAIQERITRRRSPI